MIRKVSKFNLDAINAQAVLCAVNGCQNEKGKCDKH